MMKLMRLVLLCVCFVFVVVVLSCGCTRTRQNGGGIMYGGTNGRVRGGNNSTAHARTEQIITTKKCPTHTNINIPQQYEQRMNEKKVCREFQRGSCRRPEHECRYAHPPEGVALQMMTSTPTAAETCTATATVIVCMDSIRGRCNRQPCRYFHPPDHLATSLPIDGPLQDQQTEQCGGPALLIATNGAVFGLLFSKNKSSVARKWWNVHLNREKIQMQQTIVGWESVRRVCVR